MKHIPHPGYEEHLKIYNVLTYGTNEEKEQAILKQREMITSYEENENIVMADLMIPGPENSPEVKLRIIKPKNLPEKSPIVLDIHGGGFVSGNIDIDNFRNIAIATGTPCIVVAVEYRLAPKDPFPAGLLDCYEALKWIYNNTESFGGDPNRIGLHGTSAGGNLCASLSLYVRDKGGPKISVQALINPSLSLEKSLSYHQNSTYALGDSSNWTRSKERLYLGELNGKMPSYYAFPGYCPNLSALPPTIMVVAEYDPFRDDGIKFAMNLMNHEVPCEMIMAPRVGHGFCVVDQPLTQWVHDGVCASFRREFKMI